MSDINFSRRPAEALPMSSNRSVDGDRGPDVAIRLRDVSKRYVMFERPEDRFKQMIVPRLERLAGRPPRSYFRDFAALSGISFDIGRGETVGIIGRNGSGKSTLLQIICGTLQPTSGSVEVNGRIAALLELGAGFNPEFTGRENVFLNALILGVPRKEMEWRFDDIARFAEIGHFINQPVKTYSSGMYVRLAFATAINVDPDILVVDEALAVGDEAFQRKCFARIEEIRERGGTILFVSHGAQTIVQLCDRAMLLDGGEMILQGRPRSVVAQYQRLSYAPPEAAAIIRQEIAEGTAESRSKKHSDSASVAPSEPDPEEFFDPHLKPESTVAYEEWGGRIEDIRITKMNGEQVNSLIHNAVYQMRYSVHFSAAFTNVCFAFLMKTVAGVEVSGQLSSALSSGVDVEADDVIEICMPFRAALVTGTYFSNAGVFTIDASGLRQIHRLVDGIAFRVMPLVEGRPSLGLVNLSVDDNAGHAIVTKIRTGESQVDA
ncbi:ABC transporter ATP-binding protein [Mesorhizobium sp. M0293]|uniref:ABC transporter ATP-binding protein n=1 Tax=Mesorhizobium sp. M0293 TaxID=2956930 RepID=UPI003335050E